VLVGILRPLLTAVAHGFTQRSHLQAFNSLGLFHEQTASVLKRVFWFFGHCDHRFGDRHNLKLNLLLKYFFCLLFGLRLRILSPKQELVQILVSMFQVGCYDLPDKLFEPLHFFPEQP